MLCLSILTQGSYAYFTTEGTARNVIKAGAVDVTIVEERLVNGRIESFPGSLLCVIPGTSESRYCIVPANNDYNYRTANKHLFGNTNHEFTLTSTPASRTQFGAAMDKPLTDIRYDKTTGKTTLHFRGGKPEAPDTPQNPDDTEIQNPEFKNQNSKLFHDLQGRPVAQPSKGIYIASGKKVMVR